MTADQRKYQLYLGLAEPAIQALDAFDAPDRIRQFAGRLNELSTDELQALQHHSLKIADAYIRATSGANAPEPEVQRARTMIVPMPGDTEGTLQLKRQTRHQFVGALRVLANTPAAQEEPGAADEAHPGAAVERKHRLLPLIPEG